MDIKEKIDSALSEAFVDAYIRLEEDDGISGFIVSSKFEDLSSLDRQNLIEETLAHATVSLTSDEQRQILMIAGITPREFDSVGHRIRIHSVRKKGAAVEIVLRGGQADADYVRAVLNQLVGVNTAAPKSSPSDPDKMMYLRAKGTGASPITESKILRALKANRYIEVASSTSAAST